MGEGGKERRGDRRIQVVEVLEELLTKTRVRKRDYNAVTYYKTLVHEGLDT